MNFKILYFALGLLHLSVLAMDKQPIKQEVILRDERMSPQSHKFSPQGDKIALHTKEEGFEDTLCIYHADTGNFHREISAGKLKGYKWSPQGSYLLLRTEQAALIHSAEGGNRIGELKMPSWMHVRFSNDERHIYTGEKDAPSIITVFNRNGIARAQLQKGRLGPIDPLDEQVASVLHNTSFFSTDTFEKVAEIPARLTCYSADGSLMGAYTWNAEGGEHSLFNRAFECIRRFTFDKRMGPFATINPEKMILTAYYTNCETRFEIGNSGKAPIHVTHYSDQETKSFFSLDGARQITLKCEGEFKDEVDFFAPYRHFTRIYVSDSDDEELERAKSVRLPGVLSRILYTHDPDILFLANGDILNLKTCEIIKTNVNVKPPELYTKKVKHLISKMGAYLDVQIKNGDEIVAIRQLK